MGAKQMVYPLYSICDCTENVEDGGTDDLLNEQKEHVIVYISLLFFFTTQYDVFKGRYFNKSILSVLLYILNTLTHD